MPELSDLVQAAKLGIQRAAEPTAGGTPPQRKDQMVVAKSVGGEEMEQAMNLPYGPKKIQAQFYPSGMGHRLAQCPKGPRSRGFSDRNTYEIEKFP